MRSGVEEYGVCRVDGSGTRGKRTRDQGHRHAREERREHEKEVDFYVT